MVIMNPNKSEQVTLPIAYPNITSYPSFASILSILACYKKTEAWIYNNFINLWGISELENGGGIPIRFSSWDTRKICPFLQYSNIEREVIKACYKNYVNFIISYISLGHYLFLSYDEFYISHSRNYKKKHFIHQLLIYGFNLNKETFNVADFFRHRKFSFEEVCFSDVEKAIENVAKLLAPSHDIFVDVLKYIDCEYAFDNELEIKNLCDYLNSTNTYLSYEEKALHPFEKRDFYLKKMVLGISNYGLVKDYLSKLILNKDLIHDIRPFHVLWDHKVLMILRIKYLIENGLIPNSTILCERFKTICDLCLINRNFFIKYTITGDKDILKKLIDKIDTIECDEKWLINELINELTNNKNSVQCRESRTK
jgi:hypothetical protein